MLAMGFGGAALDEKGVRPRQEFTDRVIRDKRYKVFVINARITRLHDLQRDPVEEVNLVASTDPEHRAALRRFQAITANSIGCRRSWKHYRQAAAPTRP